MIKYVHNGFAEPKFQMTAKYLSTSGSISQDKEGKYPVETTGVILMKLDISNFDTDFKAVKTDFRIKIKSVEKDTTFKLFAIDYSQYNKSNSCQLSLSDNSLVDAIYYKGKTNAYGAVDDVLEFDLTKHFYSLLNAKERTIYLALKSTSIKFEIYDIANSFANDLSLIIQMNKISGLESIYEYVQEDVGFAGISSINLANGKLIHTVEAVQTHNDKHPGAFHIYFNIDNESKSKILGDHWKYSGEYTVDYSENFDSIILTDPTNRVLVLEKCTEDTIKDMYDMEVLDTITGKHYVCMNEPMYCIVKETDHNKMVFVDKNKNRMYFGTDSRKLENIILNNGKNIHYEYHLGRISCITDGDGDHLNITYETDTVTVEYFTKQGVKVNRTVFTLVDNKLKNIKKYISNNSEIVNEAEFDYDISGRLTTITDKVSLMQSVISYSSQNQVTKITHNTLGSTDKQKYTSYDYYSFQTRVTDYTGFHTDYFFDYFGRCKNIIDEEGKSITRNYEEVYNGNVGGVIGESKLQINERNLIDNNSFDSDDNLFDEDSAWKLVSGDKSNIKVVDGGVFGQKCLRVDVKYSQVELKQELYFPEAGKYTLKSFFKAIAKTNGKISAGSLKVLVKVTYKEKVTETITTGNGSSSVNKTETITRYYDRVREYSVTNNLDGSFDWNGFEKSGVEIPGGSNISERKVMVHLILSGSNYTAYVDDISLSFGDHIVRYNYINNGYLEDRRTGWILENYDCNDDFITCNDLSHPNVLGDVVYKVSSDLSKTKKMYRQVIINGGAGEELIFTVFGKGNISKNDLMQAYIDIHYVDTNETKHHIFNFDSNFENWQIITRKIVAERAFDYVEVGVLAKAKCYVYFDAFQLYKDSFGKEYSYTEKKNMSQIVNADGTSSVITYDKESHVTEATDESGDTYRYVYNDNEQIAQISNNQNTKILFKYEGENKVETKLVTSKGEKLVTKESYYDDNRLESQTDDNGVRTDFKYDHLGRIDIQTDANGLLTKHIYDNYNQLKEQFSELENDKVRCVYTYYDTGNIETITTENGTVYRFEYNTNQQVSKVYVNGKVIVQNEYTKKINNINTNLLTRQILGDSESCGVYDFEYDEKERLTKIKFNNIDSVKYIYNERDQISEIYDAVQGVRHFVSYDTKGNIVSTSNTKGEHFSYDFDNLNNLQKLTMNVEGILRSFDYEYKCEYNDYTPSGYFNRLQRAFPDEIIKGGSGFNGIYGGKATLNTIKHSNVVDELPLGDKVPSLIFKEDNSMVSYDTTNFNKDRKAETTSNNWYSWGSWSYYFKKMKTVYGWIKPKNGILDTQKIFSFSEKEAYGARFSLSSLTSGQVELKDTLTGKLIVSDEKLIFDEWNLIGFKLDFTTKDKTKLSLIINNEIKTLTYDDKTSMYNLKYFTLGTLSSSIIEPEHPENGNDSSNSGTSTGSSGGTGSGSTGGSNSSSGTGSGSSSGSSGIGSTFKLRAMSVNMQFKLAFISVGSTNIADDDFIGIYNEGKNYLSNEPNYGASGVTYFNDKVYKGFDIISLNGSLTSMKRMKPKAYSYTEASFKVEKSRIFKFDLTGNNPLNRHVYASYDGLTNLNKGNKAKLAYDLLLKKVGTINFWFKVDELTNEERIILYSEKSGKQKMCIMLVDNLVLFRGESNSIDNTYVLSEITAGKWIFVSVRFDNGRIVAEVDGEDNHFYEDIDLEDAWTYIGCAVDSLKAPIKHLNGCFEMISFKDTFATDDEIRDIRENGESISIRSYYDEIGRTSITRIHSKSKTLEKNITYKRNGDYTTTKVGTETMYTGDKINYEYDEVGNVKLIQRTNTSGTVIDKQEYVYDGLSRLKESTINGVKHNYKYDFNNNILVKDGITYNYDSTIKDRLLSRSDGTEIIYNDRIFSNPTKIKKPNITLDLAWDGRKLQSVNDTTFSYDYNGIRVEKQIKNSYTEKYILEGTRVVGLKRIEQGKTKLVTFVYDETSSLAGLSLNEKEYFYERDTRGVINRIIDKIGSVLIEYKYDDWGKPTWTTNNTTEANELLELNPFMYKGYFYDKNTGLYYLNTRYYDPELGRFINADKEVGTVNNTMGMNLYAYCRCNPIIYADENGNWPQWLTKVCIGVAVIAVCGIVAAATAGTGAACIGMAMLVGAAKGAAIGAVTGALTGAAIGAVTEGIKTGTWEGAFAGAISGAVNGAADGFMFGAIGGAVSGVMNPKYCFVAGTLVMTKEGLKAIETIKEGDLVLAYNSNLGIYDYKDVVEVYKNKAKGLCHIYTEKEEIVCTPNHNILTKTGWKEAKDITSNDYIKTTTDFEKVNKIKIEELENEVDVYNLNVLCYHTYVIGNSLFIVHNACSTTNQKGVYELEFENGHKYIGKGSIKRMKQSIKSWEERINFKIKSARFTPCVDDKTAFILEHIKMCENGFRQEGCKLLNRIASPGKKIIFNIL